MKLAISVCLSALAISLTPAYAKSHHHYRHHHYAYRHHGGGLICGAVQMAHFGIHDGRFRLARNWARLLPHTTAQIGAVVVQSRSGRDSAGHPGGHVSRILSLQGSCRAIVADSRGTYSRDICHNLIAYVRP
jgi:hypothetical protein